MAKIPRIYHRRFGSSASSTSIGKFGSLAAGTPEYATTPEEAMSLANWLGGWESAVVGAESPSLEDENAADYVMSEQLAYIFQAGVAEWDDQTIYFKGSQVLVGEQVYASRTDNNVNNDPATDPVNWRNADLPSGTFQFGGYTTIPTGYLACDGSVQLRTAYPHLFAAIGTAFNTGGELGTQFRLPSGSRRVLVGSGGTGTGTLGNAVGNTGGEEAHTLSAAESGVPAHVHSVTDPGHTHGYTDPGHFHTNSGNYLIENGGTIVHDDGSEYSINPDPNTGTSGVGISINAASTGISGTNANGASAASSAHNNIQPSLVATMIIKI